MVNTMRNEKGFTLIEIIAVLVILGILAAVAVPKFFDLQTESRRKSVQNAIAGLQSIAIQAYSQQILNGTSNGTNWVAPGGTLSVGDFSGTISGQQTVTVTVTNGPVGWNSGIGSNYAKSFNMW